MPCQIALIEEERHVALHTPERLHGAPVVGRPVDVLFAFGAADTDAQRVGPAVFAELDVGVETIGELFARAVFRVFHLPFVEPVLRIGEAAGREAVTRRTCGTRTAACRRGCRAHRSVPVLLFELLSKLTTVESIFWMSKLSATRSLTFHLRLSERSSVMFVCVDARVSAPRPTPRVARAVLPPTTE